MRARDLQFVVSGAHFNEALDLNWSRPRHLELGYLLIKHELQLDHEGLLRLLLFHQRLDLQAKNLH